MNVLVVSGFLGSGKTTFLLGLARHLLARGTSVAVIENEVGRVAIDGASLRGGAGVHVRELFAGCICCSLRDELGRAVDEIREERSPDVLLIEPSGVAGPDIVTDAVRDRIRMDDGIATVQIVDATRTAQMLNVRSVLPPFLERSVEVCDFVILNKMDGMDAVARTRMGEWLARHGRTDAIDLDVRDERALGAVFLPRWEEACREESDERVTPIPAGGGQTRTSRIPAAASSQPALMPVHDQLLADFVARAPRPPDDEGNADRLAERVADLMEAVSRAVDRELAECTGHLKARLDPAGIAFSITDRSSHVTRSAAQDPRAPGGVQAGGGAPNEVVLRVQAIYSLPAVAAVAGRAGSPRIDIQAILDRECAQRLPEFVREGDGE